MKKIFLCLAALMSVPSMVYGQSATTGKVGQDFPLLTSSTEFSTVIGGEVHRIKFVFSTEAKFKGYVISDEGWSGLSDDDKWQVAIYEYSYRFENNSDEEINILFTNRDVLLSPLPKIFGNYSLILEPRETKVIQFTANTKLKEAYSGDMFFSLWSKETQHWELFGASSASLYVPGLNAFYEFN